MVLNYILVGHPCSLKRTLSESHCFSTQRWTLLALLLYLEIQSNNVVLDDKPYQDIFWIKLIKHVPCLASDFCFQQHDNVTRQSYFFNPSSTYLRLNKNPITPDVTGFFFIYISSFYFSLGTVFMFISEVIYSIPYPSLTLHKNLNFFSS